MYINVPKKVCWCTYCLCPNLVSVPFYAIPILHYKFCIFMCERHCTVPPYKLLYFIWTPGAAHILCTNVKPAWKGQRFSTDSSDCFSWLLLMCSPTRLQQLRTTMRRMGVEGGQLPSFIGQSDGKRSKLARKLKSIVFHIQFSLAQLHRIATHHHI